MFGPQQGFRGGHPRPLLAPCKGDGFRVPRAASTEWGHGLLSAQVLAAAEHNPPPFAICYPMARGATLAEMYEISCGKNMHADPHLVSPIMEV